jgi:hypothetical protein
MPKPRNWLLERVGGDERPAECSNDCCPDWTNAEDACECEDCWACD